jgi:cell wall-associated NlpC family hydrolase
MGKRHLLFALLTCQVIVAAGCAGRGLPSPFPTPGPHVEDPVEPAESPDVAVPGRIPSGSITGDAIVTTALTYVGVPYRWGGADPSGFDCSGLVAYVFWLHGMGLPRTVQQLAREGREVRRIEPGDLLFFKTKGRGPSHVAIAIDPDRFVHAPNSSGSVRVEQFDEPRWQERFLEARRLF